MIDIYEVVKKLIGESVLSDLLCDDVFIREDLKSQLGITSGAKGVEFCEIYDDEWHDLIKHILIKYNKLLVEKLEKKKKQRERMMSSRIRARIFNHFSEEHNILLLESEIDDVINLFRI